MNFSNRLDILADGSFDFYRIFQPCTDVDFSSREGWANVVKGSWEFDDKTLILRPKEERADNPAAKIGLEEMRFRVIRGLKHVRIVSGEGKSAWSLRK